MRAKLQFLTPEEVTFLTGRSYKHDQAAQLEKMGIPFALNGMSRPLVPVAAIEGSSAQARREVQEIKVTMAARLARLSPPPKAGANNIEPAPLAEPATRI